MKSKKLIVVAFSALFILSAFTTYQSTNWKISEGYAIKFTSENPAGIFNSFQGDISFDTNDLSNSYFDVSIDVKSINTGNGMKNKHAKGKKWFDADKYPKITFKSSKIEKDNNAFSVTGKLKIKDVEKEITIPVNFDDNTFITSFNVNRLDYHVGTMKGMSKKAAQDLKIDISIPVTK